MENYTGWKAVLPRDKLKLCFSKINCPCELTLERFNNLSTACLRACSHEGGGPQVGEVPRLGGVTNLSIQSLFFSWLLSHERWGTSPRRVARSAVPGNPLRWGEFSPCECWSGVGWCLAGHLSIIKPIERLTGRLKMLNLMPNISVRQD